MWSWLMIGVGVGILAAVPLAWGWSQRVAARTRSLQRRVQTHERLAELGTMTSGLAHEIKNPLSTVNLNVQLMQEDLDDLNRRVAGDKQAQQDIASLRRRSEMLSREVARLRDILEDFLQFAGRVQLDRQEVQLHELIGDLIDFFEPQAREAKVTIRPQLNASTDTLQADPALLKQAFLNLMLNAVQAMSQARARGVPHGGADELLLQTEWVSGKKQPDVLRVHVIDTGPGIANEALPRIFEPYFSSKRRGSGLGLPTTRRLIEEHGGQIEVHTVAGQGTDFVITLPIG